MILPTIVVATAFSASIVSVTSSDCVIQSAGKSNGLTSADDGRELHQGDVILCKKNANSKAIGVTYKIGSSVLTTTMDGVPERINVDSVDSSFTRSGNEAYAPGKFPKIAKDEFKVLNTKEAAMFKLEMKAIGASSGMAVGLDTVGQDPVGKNKSAIIRKTGKSKSCNFDLTAHFDDGTSKVEKNVDVCTTREVQF